MAQAPERGPVVAHGHHGTGVILHPPDEQGAFGAEARARVRCLHDAHGVDRLRQRTVAGIVEGLYTMLALRLLERVRGKAAS